MQNVKKGNKANKYPYRSAPLNMISWILLELIMSVTASRNNGCSFRTNLWLSTPICWNRKQEIAFNVFVTERQTQKNLAFNGKTDVLPDRDGECWRLEGNARFLPTETL